MTNRDYPYLLTQLEKRVDRLEKAVSIKTEKDFENDDWDNATLMQRWQISLRTTANYRNQGLDYYKLGGRIYYTPEQRRKFIEISNNNLERLNNEGK